MYQLVVIEGRLGGDPQMRYTQDGMPVTTFSVATSEVWKKDGEKHEKTVWWKVSCWGPTADVANNYLNKGDAVLVQGKIQADEKGNPRIWFDDDKNPHASFELRADVIRLQGSKKDNTE